MLSLVLFILLASGLGASAFPAYLNTHADPTFIGRLNEALDNVLAKVDRDAITYNPQKRGTWSPSQLVDTTGSHAYAPRTHTLPFIASPSTNNVLLQRQRVRHEDLALL